MGVFGSKNETKSSASLTFSQLPTTTTYQRSQSAYSYVSNFSPPKSTVVSSTTTYGSQPTSSQHRANINQHLISQRSTASVQVTKPSQSIKVSKPIPLHDANNYIIPKTEFDNQMKAKTITVPVGIKVDRFQIKVCPKYFSRRGCNMEYCYRFHVCQYWIKSTCIKKNCGFDHHFHSEHNRNLLFAVVNVKFEETDLMEKLKRNMYSGKAMREDLADCICMVYLLNKCSKSNCVAKHSDSQYVWQVYFDGKWTDVPKNINDEIETGFKNPNNTRIIVAPTPSKQPSRVTNMLAHLFSISNKVDFEDMSLIGNNQFYRLKRISTPSDIASFYSTATRWLWFWEDEGNFQFYESAIVKDYFVIPFSDYIETQFLKKEREFTFRIPNQPRYTYAINFDNMTQTNQSTFKKRKLRRRPMAILETRNWKENTTFRSLWGSANSDRKYQRKLVSAVSCEFSFVKKMFTKTVASSSHFVVERVENKHLWQAYQLKKLQMQSAFKQNGESLNEQYLFHGTCEAVLDKICSDNFDWRLYGSNVGNIFGRGTYFARDASLANSYAKTSESNYKFMFIALVLVGTAVVGESDMPLPPLDPKTNRRFDTTVNTERNPSIFVKYNLDEYYPAYLVKYK